MSTGQKTIVGLIGFAHTGKSEVAKVLMNEYGFARVKFADGLKNMLRAIGLTEEEIEGALKEQPCEKLGGQTPRHAMMTLGTEWGRKLIHEDIWVLAWRKYVLDSSADRIVVDDCRFLNEAGMIRKIGGNIWHIVRPGYGPLKDHPSELEHLEIRSDAYLKNDETVEDLRYLVRRHAFKLLDAGEHL
jgi:hypothetical protein